jgi:hypothetical protein
MHRPLSAVASLAVPADPSIAPLAAPSAPPEGGGEASDRFMRAMLSCSEETGKGELYSALRETVVREGGVLPSAKKRGVGAEVLTLVNAISAAAAAASERDGAMGGEVMLRSQGLLAWSTAVIDAMQRSSAKQLQAHLQSMGVQHATAGSFETRGAREKEVLQTVWQQAQLGLLSAPLLVDHIIEVTGLRGSERGMEADGKSQDKDKECVDIQHLLMLVVG